MRFKLLKYFHIFVVLKKIVYVYNVFLMFLIALTIQLMRNIVLNILHF